jgi:hypothetical protein
MPVPYDWAEHWAEAAGCRLLTDLEFAYLAYLADKAQAGRERLPDAIERFDTAGGTALDEIPTNPPIRGILTGYAEWTSTWAHSPQVTVNVLNGTIDANHPQLYRVIRGGTINCGAGDYPRKPQTADISILYSGYPHVGFRLARSPSEDPEKKQR